MDGDIEYTLVVDCYCGWNFNSHLAENAGVEITLSAFLTRPRISAPIVFASINNISRESCRSRTFEWYSMLGKQNCIEDIVQDHQRLRSLVVFVLPERASDT
jgi:hypothetical protein